MNNEPYIAPALRAFIEARELETAPEIAIRDERNEAALKALGMEPS